MVTIRPAQVRSIGNAAYGRADVTVGVYRNTENGWVLHHIRHFPQK